MNLADLCVMAVIAGSMAVCYKRGFILSAFRLCSKFIAMAVSAQIYPPVSKALRENLDLFPMLKEVFAKTLHLEDIPQNSIHIQSDFLENMALPSFLKDKLIENHNPVAYEVLNVQSVTDYVTGYIANMCVNILSLIIVYITVSILLRMIYRSMGILSKLPLIKTLNRLSGIIFGFLQGIMMIWIVFLIITLFLNVPQLQFVWHQINASLIASKLYNYNILLWITLKIFS